MSDLRLTHWREIRDTLTGKRLAVHDLMATRPPCTACELAESAGWDKTSVRPRITDLIHAGLVEPTGERRNGEHVFRYVSLEAAEQRAREISEQPARGVMPVQLSLL